jgi:hypothetical protein
MDRNKGLTNKTRGLRGLPILLGLIAECLVQHFAVIKHVISFFGIEHNSHAETADAI